MEFILKLTVSGEQIGEVSDVNPAHDMSFVVAAAQEAADEYGEAVTAQGGDITITIPPAPDEDDELMAALIDLGWPVLVIRL